MVCLPPSAVRTALVSAEVDACLTKVESLAKPQLRYKVDVNAVENHLTGAAIITDDFCIVVVEGGE